MAKIFRASENIAKGYSEVELKVRDATNNDNTGPIEGQLKEIAKFTQGSKADFYGVIEVLLSRFKSRKKDWRQVLKALKILDYCIHQGSKLMVVWTRKNIDVIILLFNFQYVECDGTGRDYGDFVRIMAREIHDVATDDKRLESERRDSTLWKERVVEIADHSFFEQVKRNRRSGNRRQPVSYGNKDYLFQDVGLIEYSERRSDRIRRHATQNDTFDRKTSLQEPQAPTILTSISSGTVVESEEHKTLSPASNAAMIRLQLSGEEAETALSRDSETTSPPETSVTSKPSLQQLSFITAEDQEEFQHQFVSVAGDLRSHIHWQDVEKILQHFSLPDGALAHIRALTDERECLWFAFPNFALAMYFGIRASTGRQLPQGLSSRLRDEVDHYIMPFNLHKKYSKPKNLLDPEIKIENSITAQHTHDSRPASPMPLTTTAQFQGNASSSSIRKERKVRSTKGGPYIEEKHLSAHSKGAVISVFDNSGIDNESSPLSPDNDVRSEQAWIHANAKIAPRAISSRENTTPTNNDDRGLSVDPSREKSPHEQPAIRSQSDVRPILPIRTGAASSSSTLTVLQSSNEAAPQQSLARCLNAFFSDCQDDRELYTDCEIHEISTMLRYSNPRWSKVPRTYIILRVIGGLDYIDQCIDVGFTDYWFPITERSLPDFLRPSLKAAFVKAQSLILTKSMDLEKGNRGQHCYFRKGESVPFEMKGILGSGGYGQVDRVLSLISFKEYARKRVLRSTAFRGRKKEDVKQFVTEIEILKRLKHRHIVEFVGSYTDAKYIGLIMMPIADMDLTNYLKSATASDHPELRTFFGCLATALEFLHDQNVRHKDVKPSNVLVSNGKVLFADFGLSLDFSDATGSTTMSMVNGMTPRYCAPEVANYEARNTKSDIWCLGVVFLEMIATIKGCTTQDIDGFFKQHGSQQVFVRLNIAALPEVVAHLSELGQAADNRALEWVQQMLSEEQKARPTASTLVAWITTPIREGDSTSFCGICCMAPEEEDSSDYDSE